MTQYSTPQAPAPAAPHRCADFADRDEPADWTCPSCGRRWRLVFVPMEGWRYYPVEDVYACVSRST